MIKIVAVPDFPSAVSAIVSELDARQLNPSLIRLEGFCGSGKTGLARALSQRISASHIAGDNYANKLNPTPAYPLCIRQDELNEVIGKAIGTGSIVILDAVCLNDIAPMGKWGRGLVVYIKRLSFNNQDSPLRMRRRGARSTPTMRAPTAASIHFNNVRQPPAEWEVTVLQTRKVRPQPAPRAPRRARAPGA